MSDYNYDRLPTSDEKQRFPQHAPTSDVHELHRRLAQDPRFNPPPPSAWKRIALVLFLFALCWLGLRLRLAAIPGQAEAPVVHANRYVVVFTLSGGRCGLERKMAQKGGGVGAA